MEQFNAKVIKIVFHNQDNGYTIARVKNNLGSLSVKGYFSVVEHRTYEFGGEMDEDPTYGPYLLVSSVKEYIDDSENGIINYLSSDLFTGVGKSSARKIYQHFGDKTIEILKQDPEAIHEVEGLSKNACAEIKNVIQKNDLANVLAQTLQPFDVSPLMVNRIYQLIQHWEDPIVDLKNNPYRLLNYFSDEKISFNLADRLYCGFNEDHYSYLRLSNVITNAIVEYCFKTGDSYISNELLHNQVTKQYNIVDELIIDTLDSMEKDNHITRFDSFIQLTSFINCEAYITDQVQFRLKHMSTPVSKNFKDVISEFSANHKINLAPLQKKALEMALSQPVSIVTGGPGTGKTTIINGLVYSLSNTIYNNLDQDQLIDKIALVAPTGRASYRMMESTGYPAKTIHSLLGIKQTSGQARYDEKNKLPLEYIIIDEFSMVDMFLFRQLLKALESTCRIIIVGDPDQLESVGPGSLLRDFLNSGVIPTTKLTDIYRQGDGSSISKLSLAIKDEQPITAGNDQEVSIIDIKTNLINNVEKVVNKSLASGFDITKTQVLYTRYQGEVGIDHFNQILHPETKGKMISFSQRDYFVGDKIMILKNDYDLDVYNGDIGFITKIYDEQAKGNETAIEIEIRNRKIDLTYKELNLLTHAYCISVHKSQGSEFDVVILPIHDQFMLTKKVIYTAITRARKKLIIIGDVNKLNNGICKNDYYRNTRIKQLLEREI